MERIPKTIEFQNWEFPDFQIRVLSHQDMCQGTEKAMREIESYCSSASIQKSLHENVFILKYRYTGNWCEKFTWICQIKQEISMKCHIWKWLLPYTPVYREIIAIFLICYGFVGRNFWEGSFSWHLEKGRDFTEVTTYINNKSLTRIYVTSLISNNLLQYVCVTYFVILHCPDYPPAHISLNI